MTVLQITCDNCGAKYKLPETFKGAQAKCQKCGSVIDVAAQRAAAGGSAPAAEKPAAAAKPAVDRSKVAPASARSTAKAADEKPARSGARSRRGQKDEGGDEGGASGRRDRNQKKDQTPMILGGVGVLVLVVVGVIFLTKGGDKPAGAPETSTAAQKSADTPPTNAAASNPAPEKPAEQPAASTPSKPAEQPAATPAAPPQATPSQAVATPAPSQPAAGEPTPAASSSEPPAPEIPGQKKEPWENMRNPPSSMADVKRASERYGNVPWPAVATDAKKAELLGIVADIDPEGGQPTIRAKRKLAEEGYLGFFAIVEKLRGLDYTQVNEARLGFELNKVIEEITNGLNARYAPVGAGETLTPAKAEWNTRTVEAWLRVLAGFPDEESFRKNKASRASQDK
jgi:hypothetical protein